MYAPFPFRSAFIAVLEISSTCHSCGKECRATVSHDADAGIVRCNACGLELLKFRGVKGYIYVLSNPKMPGLVKIGCTTRRVEERLRELSEASGVPVPFTLEASFESAAPEEHEAEIHRRLAAQRVEGREFFEIETTAAVQMAQAVVRGQAINPSGTARVQLPSAPVPPTAAPGTLRERVRDSYVAIWRRYERNQ
jgi:ribosomal protein S27E